MSYITLFVLAVITSISVIDRCFAKDIIEVPERIVFQEANDLYKNDEVAAAAKMYKQLIDRGRENGILYYNLGNAHMKTGEFSQALWGYLKAQAFIPRDADLQANREYVQSLIGSVEHSVVAPRVIRWITLNQQFSSFELAWGFVVILWLTVLGWISYGWCKPLQRGLKPLVWVMTSAAIAVLFILTVQTAAIDSIQRVVIIQDQLEVKFAPQQSGTSHFTLPEGSVVRVLNRELEWMQIQRNDGLAGWVLNDSILLL